MIPRDYRATANAVADNIDATIEQHPDAFECLLYRADLTSPETVAANADVVGSMETSERGVTYLDPIEARALQIVEGPFFLEGANTGEVPDGNREQPILLVLNIDPVPEQSVVQYEEMTDDDNRRLVSLYVVRSDTIGSAPAKKLRHYCIPFHSFAGDPSHFV